MDIQFYGANCITLATKQLRVTVDDNLAELGVKSISKPDDVALFTQPQTDMRPAKLAIDQPGEYEVAGVLINGIQSRSHIDEEDKKTATIYKILIDDIRVLIVGHIYPELTESQLEMIGMVDVMVVPVGNSGYTMDAIGALKLIKKIEPKIIIPTHYEDKDLKYPVPQQSLEQAIKELGMEPAETVSKLRLKAGELSALTKLVTLEKSK